ncbi:MAG: fluoride efflux transporter CrcB [Bacteroidetes bacterium]|nr:fluoride efflux transporter CrcB [Bacteroidota bacterium]
MQNYLIVSIGAAFGGAARYWVTNVVYKFLPSTLPYGTLAVNIIGSFIIGFVMFYLDKNELISPQMRILLTTGFCGGLTTFSTFSFETINLMRDSEFLLAGTNIILNVVLSISAVFIAYLIGKIISGG